MRMSAGSRGIFCPSEIGTTLQLLRYENSSGTDETGAYRASGMPKQNFAPLNVATSSGLVEYVEWPCKIGRIITSRPQNPGAAEISVGQPARFPSSSASTSPGRYRIPGIPESQNRQDH
jgi:hypothetical protein